MDMQEAFRDIDGHLPPQRASIDMYIIQYGVAKK